VPSAVLQTFGPDERLQLALDAGAIAGTWFWDVQADVFTADSRFADRFSLDEHKLRSGMALAEVTQSIHPEDVERVKALIGQALVAGGPYRAQYRVLRSSGTYSWIEANGKVLLDSTGLPLSFPGVLIEIDRHKAVEAKSAALIKLGNEFRGFGAASAIASTASRICGECLEVTRTAYGVVPAVEDVVDVQGNWSADDTWLSLSGVYQFEAYGTYIADLRRGEVVSIADVALDARTAGQQATFDHMQIRALLNVPLMRDGRLVGIFIALDSMPRIWTPEEVDFVRSVADRTWAAFELANAHALLQNQVKERTEDRDRLWELSRDMLLVAAFTGEILATNPAWNRVLGWSDHELLGTSIFDLVHPDDRDPTINAASAVGEGTEFASFENRYRCKDGSYRNISWSARPGDNAIIASGRDVTVLLEQVKSLRDAEDQLRQSQKMEAVGQLTGGIAHDFNNLLTIISTSIQLLQRPGIADDRRQRFMGAISNAVVRAGKLTGQLLAFARRQSLKPEVFDAKDNVAAIGDMIQTLIGSRVRLSLKAAGQACLIHADTGQFDTAIVNMCANARDAMDHVGDLIIETRIVPSLPAIRSHPAVARPHVAVSVSDTGSGIAADRLDRVFEPFYTTKAVGQGTGLGLSQVFGFAKQSHGDVQVKSVVGEGTTFTVYLPLSQSAVSEEQVSDEEGWSHGSEKGWLLLVEDNPDVATTTSASLEELGFEVFVASSGAEALAVLAEGSHSFCAMVSDVMMAPMDGIDLATQVRTRHPALPILLCSGYSSVLASNHDHGFTLLPKPYGMDQLVKSLREVMRETKPIQDAAKTDEPSAASDLENAEHARLSDLESLGVLDTGDELECDEVTSLAAALFDAPMALISMIDSDRQWFKARIGFPMQETPREQSFCAHAIQRPDEVMVVTDATQDPRFAHNPLVTGEPFIRFYVGAPLVTSWGHAIGTVCIIDTVARKAQPRQLAALKILARQVVQRLEHKRSSGEA
jgi:PAS domain S-box-containing protein